MYQIDNATAVAVRPAATAAGTAGWFTDGNPGGGVPATIVPGEFLNMLMAELMALPAAVGITLSKASSNQVLAAISAMGATVGTMRNAVMNLTAASASATFTADEIVVETALGGVPLRLASFNKTINLATTGAGGMDTGTAPVSGYVALYAIYNPTTQTAALLAANATSAVAPEIYGGANMPAGYTASALVSVWPTNASSQFVAGYQRDRAVTRANSQVLNTSTAAPTVTSLSIASAIPKNAKSISATVGASSSVAAQANIAMVSDTSSIGLQQAVGSVLAGGSVFGNITDLVISTSQTIWYTCTVSAGTGTFVINLEGYKF